MDFFINIGLVGIAFIFLGKLTNKENKNIKYMVQIFDGNNTEEKVELENSEKLVNKDLAIRFNKKVKIFC